MFKALAGLMLLGAASSGTAAPTVYRDATLVDGAVTKRGMAIVVEGERMTAVVADKDAPAGTIVDLKGQFVFPGLIDSHVHVATPPNRRQAEAILRRDLYGGVTAVRDMADDLRSVAEIARASQQGEIAAPDLYFAALMAGPSFFTDPRVGAASRGWPAGKTPWMQAIDETTDLRQAVTLARGTGASAIKVYANLPGPMVAKIIAEAHRQKIAVWAHGAVFPASPAEVIAAGPDVVSHVCYLAYQVSDAVPASYQQRVPVAYDRLKGDNPVIGKLFAEMVRKGEILDPTGRVYVEYDQRAKTSGKPPLCTAELAARMMNQAYRAGVQMTTGTDGVGAPDALWPELFDELIFQVEQAKIPAADVMRSATLVGARSAGQEAQMGSIAPGKLANLAVFAKNPVEDIRNIRSLTLTVKRGRNYRRADFKPLTAEELKD